MCFEAVNNYTNSSKLLLQIPTLKPGGHQASNKAEYLELLDWTVPANGAGQTGFDAGGRSAKAARTLKNQERGESSTASAITRPRPQPSNWSADFDRRATAT
jgi:hypothetical protein